MASELVSTDFFKMAEATDEKQIMNIDEVKDVLCYKDTRSGKYELSYRGIKTLVLEMAAKGFPLEIVTVESELMGDGEEKTWYCTIKLRNQTTKLETLGDAEQPYYENDGKYPPTFRKPLVKDSFAKRKAYSKAERNASKKQLPEPMIVHLVNRATTRGSVRQLEPAKCNCPSEIIIKLPSVNSKCPNCGKLR